MSVSVAITQVIEMPGDGARLVRYDRDTDELFIYPEGLGKGPLLIVSRASWRRLIEESRLAMIDSLHDYTACEGNGHE